MSKPCLNCFFLMGPVYIVCRGWAEVSLLSGYIVNTQIRAVLSIGGRRVKTPSDRLALADDTHGSAILILFQVLNTDNRQNLPHIQNRLLKVLEAKCKSEKNCKKSQHTSNQRQIHINIAFGQSTFIRALHRKD